MIYFIRHGQSKYNIAEQMLIEKIGNNYLDAEEYLNSKFDSIYYDVELTEKGEEQARNAKKEVQNIDFDLIICSPLRRALHTCSIIFEGHKSKAQIIVYPQFREIMESSNDLGTKLVQSKKLFKNFNFERIVDEQAWYLLTLSDPKLKQEFLAKLGELKGQQRHKRAQELALDLMRKNWKERREHPEQEEQLKKIILPSYPQQNAILKQLLQKHKSIAVVAHSECIKHYAGYKIKNCQVFPYDGNKL